MQVSCKNNVSNVLKKIKKGKKHVSSYIIVWELFECNMNEVCKDLGHVKQMYLQCVIGWLEFFTLCNVYYNNT